MSRRKLGSRPQHLSAIQGKPGGNTLVCTNSAGLKQVQAPEDDLLTCGQCSQAFPLAHILAFIQHKQGGCVSRSPGSGATPPSPPAASTFPQPGALQADFHCELCDQNFHSLRALSAHRRTHACDRPYHCGVCGQAFAQSGQLARHIRGHHREAAGGGSGCESVEAVLMEEDTGRQGARGRLQGPGMMGKELDLTLPKHPTVASGLMLLNSHLRPPDRELLRLYPNHRAGGEEAAEGQGEPQPASPCASPSEGSLESGDTGGSGESGIASGNCTPKRPEMGERARGVGEWENEQGELVEREKEWASGVQEWQRDFERRSAAGPAGKKKKDEA
uniref:C2H2-type domain-containing protein n=1 Tax=Poecilia formosa TaxID=48698 RepID=A0A087XXN5_POEFO